MPEKGRISWSACSASYRFDRRLSQCTVGTPAWCDLAGGAPQTSLKFWERRRRGGEDAGESYTLSTQVEDPHGDDAVTGLAYHPLEHSAVSSGSDGTFRHWAALPRRGTGGNKGLRSWVCLAKASYKRACMHGLLSVCLCGPRPWYMAGVTWPV
jgi:hypothetical protein